MTGSGHSEVSTVESFVANLPELLVHYSRDPRCIVAVASFPESRYVQFRTETDGSVIIEVSSNGSIGAGRQLSLDDELELRDAGWSEPENESRPNWRIEASRSAEMTRAIYMTVAAIYCALRENPSNAVKIRSWAVGQA